MNLLKDYFGLGLSVFNSGLTFGLIGEIGGGLDFIDAEPFESLSSIFFGAVSLCTAGGLIAGFVKLTLFVL